MQSLKENEKDPSPENLFSVIIPTLNEEKYLPKLLQDLEKQSFKGFSVTIVDANSQDNTKREALKFKDKFSNFSFIESDKKGSPYQKNLGAKKTKSIWLLFIDADCRLPNYFLQGIKYHTKILNPDILSTWFEPDSKETKDKTLSTIVNIFIDLQKNTKSPYVSEAVFCIKRSSFEKLQGFGETLHWGEGNDIVRRATRRRMHFEIVKNPKYVFSFRRMRTLGMFKTIRNSAQIEFARLAKISLSKRKNQNLYPMGGHVYNLDKKSTSTFNKIALYLLENIQTTNGNSKNGHSLIEKLITKLKTPKKTEEVD